MKKNSGTPKKLDKSKTHDYETSESSSENSECSECRNIQNWHAQALAKVQASCNSSNELKSERSYSANSDKIFTPHAIFGSYSNNNCNELSDCSLNSSEIFLKTQDMSSKRQLYETAFDSVINQKEKDDINLIENITKNQVLFPFPSDLLMITNPKNISKARVKKKNDDLSNHKDDSSENNMVTLAMKGLLIDDNSHKNFSKPSPPSTAPLPLKFSMKNEDRLENTIKSTPNLPNSNALQCSQELNVCSDLGKSISGKDASHFINVSSFKKCKSEKMPHSELEINSVKLKSIQDIKKRKFKTFSSADSIRSSNNSIDSMRSCTSEEARSTSSSESHRSSSISSHDSDSGSSILYQLKNHNTCNTKLQILSPISDKSVQDPDIDISKTKDLTKTSTPKSKSSVEDQMELKNNCISNKLLSSLASTYVYIVYNQNH